MLFANTSENLRHIFSWEKKFLPLSWAVARWNGFDNTVEHLLGFKRWKYRDSDKTLITFSGFSLLGLVQLRTDNWQPLTNSNKKLECSQLNTLIWRHVWVNCLWNISLETHLPLNYENANKHTQPHIKFTGSQRKSWKERQFQNNRQRTKIYTVVQPKVSKNHVPSVSLSWAIVNTPN